MTGFNMTRMPWLVNAQGLPVGVKMPINGEEVYIPSISRDGMSLVDQSGGVFSPVPGPSVQKVTNPASGSTVQMIDTGRDGTLYIKLDAPIANLTVALPTNAKSRDGQIRRIATNQEITTLNVTGAEMLSTVESLSRGDCVQFERLETNVWTVII